MTPPNDAGDVVVGLMSGTSLDGISAAVARFTPGEGEAVEHELLGFTTVAYGAQQRQRLLAAMDGGSAAEYCRLAFDLGSWFAAAAVNVVEKAGLAMGDVRAIASHGQTVWHEAPHSTWQIGESAVIAEATGRPVVSDFRVRDVASGGQGAPLVPIADMLLYSSPNEWRLLQNIGGIGNVSVVAPGGVSIARAFDTGPGMSVTDAIVRRLTGRPFDADARLATAGESVDRVVDTLMRDDYYGTVPPKSTGRELFNEQYVSNFVELIRREKPTATTEDFVATSVELTARSIGDQYSRFITEPAADVVLSGGGARNPELVRRIARHVAPLSVVRFDDVFYDGEAKEAVAFALLGWLHLRGRAGNVPSATGAPGLRVLGKLTPA
ncbi:MAG TPA: anhydro-N-acetylmuramic acid kinase [Gemmatimonadales bacterium]|nr:anhydro-N-acetylmuramic acid kinase [Gemmatimonadales bacterium]